MLFNQVNPKNDPASWGWMLSLFPAISWASRTVYHHVTTVTTGRQNMMVSVSDILRRQNRLQAQHAVGWKTHRKTMGKWRFTLW